MAENGTIFKTRTYDFFVPFNEPKQLPKSKCAYIEDHARVLPAPGVIEQQNNVNNVILVFIGTFVEFYTMFEFLSRGHAPK